MTLSSLTPDDPLIPPYGGPLVSLLASDTERVALFDRATTLPTIQLSARSLCDVELLAVGAFSPLDRFMGEADFASVAAEMRLQSGLLWPIPIFLPVDEATKERLTVGQDVALRDARNNVIAVMTVEELYPWAPDALAQQVLGTTDPRHPTVAEMQRWGDWAISGPLRVLALPQHHDFTALRLTPMQARERLARLGRNRVVAFQTRNPLHRAHEELTKRAIERYDATLLLHPVVGMTKPGDVDHFTRVRSYRALAGYYPPNRILLSLLPLAMWMAGPREALWHAIIRRNFGATHLIVGRDHAGPGLDSAGEPFYGPYDAQALVEKHSAELGVTPVPFNHVVYLPDEGRYEEEARVGEARVSSLSGTQVRRDYLERGEPLPDWFTRPEVAAILSERYPPRHRQGVCLWFTGLSGAGKSTTADVLTVLLMERGRQVTVLDGDVVRTHLSKGLGFSAEDRDTNILRIGFVAAEIVRHGGVALCAAVSPYRATRDAVRAMVGGESFVEIFVDTPIEVCEERDTKGYYAKARRGEIANFTGVDDPYEPPNHPELVLNTVGTTPEANARRILDYLHTQGLVRE